MSNILSAYIANSFFGIVFLGLYWRYHKRAVYGKQFRRQFGWLCATVVAALALWGLTAWVDGTGCEP